VFIAFPSELCKKVVDDKQNMYKITEGQNLTPDSNLVSVNYIINDIDKNKEVDEEMATLVEANVDLIQEVDHTGMNKIICYLTLDRQSVS